MFLCRQGFLFLGTVDLNQSGGVNGDVSLFIIKLDQLVSQGPPVRFPLLVLNITFWASLWGDVGQNLWLHFRWMNIHLPATLMFTRGTGS